MKKRFGVTMFLVVTVALLAGCWFNGLVRVSISPASQTCEIVHSQGYGVATWTVDGDEGEVSIDFGDGAEDHAEIGADLSPVTVEHRYTEAGEYIVRVTQGPASATATVHVVAALPIVRLPFWWQGYVVDKYETIHFQVSESAHACDTATGAFDLYGISAGDGETEVRMFAWDANGTPIGIFDFSRPQGDQAIWGEWVPMPDIKVEALTFSVFMNYHDLDTPKLPLAPRGLTLPAAQSDSVIECGLAPRGCDDPDEWPEPPAPPGVGEDGYGLHAKFLLEARNQYTAEGSEPSVFWRVWYKEDGCQ